ncbi:HeH/LEM domain-containing protein [Acinetobacter sp. WCHAc060007]|uniref:HeH/LEM domain-containing protein n=1 Tax=Acinetobacter sp. WCHAc060007 TaxID=2419605 RepID=UPI000EA058AB|nr:HeH/LEM domain-containing protein [Acinetobacter sp. WCHAc060007]RKG37886.1 HeH/LEM domain protein [Acinetobacter sp. WCHAc060007]
MKTIKIKPSSPDQGDFVVINESDFDPKVHELVEGETPHQTIAVTLTTSISPELQATIDRAQAECEKVVAENAELKGQLETLKSEMTQGEPADLTGLIPVEQFDALALDLTNTKAQLATVQGELIAFKNDVGAMQARIAELQSVDYSKLKVDELKDVLKLKSIEFPSDAKKDDLLALLTKE